MKKKILALSFILCAAFLSAKENIVDWKGAEFGADSSPKWITQLFVKNNTAKFIKENKLNKSDLIFYGKATGMTAQIASGKAELVAKKQCMTLLGGGNNVVLTGLQKVSDFWVCYDDGGDEPYEAYSVFRMTKDNFEVCRSLNEKLKPALENKNVHIILEGTEGVIESVSTEDSESSSE